MGFTIPKIADRGELGGYYTLNHIVKVGKYTLPDHAKGKQYATVKYLMQGLSGVGRLLIVDSAYTTIDLLEDAKVEWKTRVNQYFNSSYWVHLSNYTFQYTIDN